LLLLIHADTCWAKRINQKKLKSGTGARQSYTAANIQNARNIGAEAAELVGQEASQRTGQQAPGGAPCPDAQMRRRNAVIVVRC
jgi:hypothetical protein